MKLMREVWLITSGMLCIVGERKKRGSLCLHIEWAAPGAKMHRWIHTHIHMRAHGSYTTRWARSASQLSST